MDRDTAVTRISDKLGFRTDVTTRVINALQDAQDEMERGATLPPFLVKQDQTLTVTAPATPVATPLEVTLPTDFIRETDYQDGNLRYQKSTPGPMVFLEKMDYTAAEEYFFARQLIRWNVNIEVIETEDTDFTAGTPMVYVLRKDTVRIYPGPDQNYSLLWDYYGHDDAVSGGNVTNRWLTNSPWLLIAKAGILVATDLRDAEALQYFQGLEQGATRDHLAMIYSREVAGRSHSMGSRL